MVDHTGGALSPWNHALLSHLGGAIADKDPSADPAAAPPGVPFAREFRMVVTGDNLERRILFLGWSSLTPDTLPEGLGVSDFRCKWSWRLVVAGRVESAFEGDRECV
jgi:hypothetical protein